MDLLANKAKVFELNGAFAREFTDCGFKASFLYELDGIQIRAFRRTTSVAKPMIYISAGMHGDEPAGPLALLEMVRSGFFDERANWLVCPILNPTGLVAETRENANGIDLNRDYLNPASVETKNHIAWLEQQGSVDLSISLHEDYESTGFYLYEINCISCPSFAQNVLEAVSPILPPEPEPLIDDHEVREPGWIFHEPEADLPDQWPEAIWLAKHGTAVSYTFETPSSEALEQRIAAQLCATRTLVECYAS